MNKSPKGKGKLSFKIFEEMPLEKRRSSFNQDRRINEGEHPMFDQ
jgi:hypothetical protein